MVYKKVVIGGVLMLAALVLAIWALPTVVMITAPLIMFMIPEDEEQGDCTIIKSKGAFAETERHRSFEYVCEGICMDTQIHDVDGYDILCQFESETASWEKPPS